MPFSGVNSREESNLTYEVIPYKVRLNLTRLIRYLTKGNSWEETMIKQNRFTNIANAVLHKPIYKLECDHMGDYLAQEAAWHDGEIELIMRLPNTIELIEILGDLIENELLEEDDVNKILRENNCSFYYKYKHGEVKLNILQVEQIKNELGNNEIPNIRLLVERMDTSLKEEDYPSVIHASASVFETLAKDILDNPNIEDKSFGSFFESYRKKSNLPDPIIDYLLELYKKRNEEPLAGHGSTKIPTISKDEAIIIVEMTKAFVRIERKLGEQAIGKI